MESNTTSANLIEEIIKAGWVFGNKDEFAGDRIYPAYSESKNIPMRHVRVIGSAFILHNPWQDTVVAEFPTLTEVLAYVEKNGRVREAWCNVWD